MNGVNVTLGGETSVVHHPLKEIHTVSILQSDLEHLENHVAEELTALGFTTGLLSAAISIGATWHLTTNTTIKQDAIYTAVTLVLGLGGIAALIVWFLKRRLRSALFRRMHGAA